MKDLEGRAALQRLEASCKAADTLTAQIAALGTLPASAGGAPNVFEPCSTKSFAGSRQFCYLRVDAVAMLTVLDLRRACPCCRQWRGALNIQVCQCWQDCQLLPAPSI